MANAIYRRRIINDIEHGIREAQNAALVAHPGLIGRIREILTQKIIAPMLPAGFEVGTGKIVDKSGQQSDEVDVVIYNRAVLPPVMFSERDGVFPVESAYYAIEVKSQLSATEVEDAVRKGRSVIGLNVRATEQAQFPNMAPTVLVLFAFNSDLSSSSTLSELERYSRHDPDWQRDPVLKAICVVGRGYWYHRAAQNSWVFHPASPDHDEVIDLVSGITNTLITTPPFKRAVPFGHYLSIETSALVIGSGANAAQTPEAPRAKPDTDEE